MNGAIRRGDLPIPAARDAPRAPRDQCALWLNAFRPARGQQTFPAPAALPALSFIDKHFSTAGNTKRPDRARHRPAWSRPRFPRPSRPARCGFLTRTTREDKLQATQATQATLAGIPSNVTKRAQAACSAGNWTLGTAVFGSCVNGVFTLTG